MLRTLRLQNYRCFRDHTVTFQASTVIVGKNNAGKSTIVEALHLVAAAVNRSAATFVAPPTSLELGRFQRCIALRANIDETVLPVVITEQGENRNQCEEQRNLFGFSHGFARRGT